MRAVPAGQTSAERYSQTVFWFIATGGYKNVTTSSRLHTPQQWVADAARYFVTDADGPQAAARAFYKHYSSGAFTADAILRQVFLEIARPNLDYKDPTTGQTARQIAVRRGDKLTPWG